jgi:hypothetical protein
MHSTAEPPSSQTSLVSLKVISLMSKPVASFSSVRDPDAALAKVACKAMAKTMAKGMAAHRV